MCPSAHNLLPFDGILNYNSGFLNEKESAAYFTCINDNTLWRKEELYIFGKLHRLERRVAWYGDKAYLYRYSGQGHCAGAWFSELKTLRDKITLFCGESLNACLLNYYPDGKSGMGWHSDDESSIVRSSCIASLSLGAARPFQLRHRKRHIKTELLLEPGSLLLMKGSMQEHWQHALPKRIGIRDARINLTFRLMKE